MDAANVWIVIPAFNEQNVIGDVVAPVVARYPNVVVVDDGSADATEERAVEAGAIGLRHVVNLGQGAALQTGIDFALSRNAQYIVTFDADGQHRPEDIGALLRALQNEEVDIVFGSRFLGGSEGVPPARRLILRMGILFTFLTTGMWMSDAHNGLRALTADTARRIRLRHNGMAHASEIIEQTVDLRLSYREVPVTVSYSRYSLAKGQRFGNALHIVADLIGGRMLR